MDLHCQTTIGTTVPLKPIDFSINPTKTRRGLRPLVVNFDKSLLNYRVYPYGFVWIFSINSKQKKIRLYRLACIFKYVKRYTTVPETFVDVLLKNDDAM